MDMLFDLYNNEHANPCGTRSTHAIINWLGIPHNTAPNFWILYINCDIFIIKMIRLFTSGQYDAKMKKID